MAASSKLTSEILKDSLELEADLHSVKWIVRNRDINYLYKGKTIIHLFMELMDRKDIEIKKEFKVQKDKPEMTYAVKLFHCLQDVVGSRIKSVNLNILDKTGNTPITILLKKEFEDDEALKRFIFEYFTKHKRFIDYEMQTEGEMTVREVFDERAPYIEIPSVIRQLDKNFMPAMRQCNAKKIKDIVREYDINQLFEGKKTIIHLFMENMDHSDINPVEPKEKTSRHEENEYKDSKASKLLQCLQDVLQRQTNPININILDETGNTPLTILLEKKFPFHEKIKKDAIDYFLREVLIDFDLVTGGNQSVREVFEREAPDIKIPTKIESACYNGDLKALKVFLTDNDVTSAINRKGPLLAILVKQICKSKDYLKYLHCFEHLLKFESISKEVHQVHDDNHAAIKLAELVNKKDVIMKLLNVSLYIGLGKSIAHAGLLKRVKLFFEQPEFSLESINPDIIEEHLNTCVTTKPNLSERHEEYSIKFNYESFNRLEYNEMNLCHHLTRDADLERLLRHPVIYSFILIRWQQFKLYFYISLILNAIFFSLAIFYFTFCNGWFCVPQFHFIPVIFLAIILLNATLNFQFKTSFLVWSLFLLSLMDNIYHYKFLIFISAAGLLLCFKGASHFKLSIYVYLFQRVMINFVQMLSLYSICIIGFAFAFYKNAHDLMNKPPKNSTNETSNPNENTYVFGFDTAPMAVLKTIVMSTGEFDATEVDFMKNWIFILFFLIFIFSITIVLSNLLTGSAVKVTKEILKRADLENIIFKVKYMSRKECLTNKLKYLFKYCPILRRLIYPPGSNRSIIVYTNKILPNTSKDINEDNKNKLCIRMIKNEVMPQTIIAILTKLCRRIIHRCRSRRNPRDSQGEEVSLAERGSQSAPQEDNTSKNKTSPPTDKENRRWITGNYRPTKELLFIIDQAKKIASKTQIVEKAKPTPTVSVKPALNIGQSKSAKEKESIWNTNAENLKSGSFKEKKKKFLGYEGGHEENTALAIAAIVLGRISKPKAWSQNPMDSIIVEGMKYYKDCTEKSQSILGDTQVEITMFHKQIVLSSVTVQDCGFDELINFLTKENDDDIYGVLISNERSYGIMKIERIYYYFESIMEGCACISRFSEKADMMDYLYSKIGASEFVYYKTTVIKSQINQVN